MNRVVAQPKINMRATSFHDYSGEYEYTINFDRDLKPRQHSRLSNKYQEAKRLVPHFRSNNRDATPE
jgi:hypothetical protein